mgnify:CR=1 FL=1
MSIEGEINKLLYFLKIKKRPNFFLKKIKGIIHVGANVGQEKEEYNNNSLEVLWIEPIPEIFDQLQINIKDYPKQKALKYLLLDEDNKKLPFNIANNKGESSSIFDFGLHAKFWPDVGYYKTIDLKTSTLTTIINNEKIDLKKFQALRIDTQGSELLVLQGASEILRNFNYIITEAADFESYVGGCKIDDLSNFLKKFGFKQIIKTKFAKHPEVGIYYDVIYERK